MLSSLFFDCIYLILHIITTFISYIHLIFTRWPRHKSCQSFKCKLYQKKHLFKITEDQRNALNISFSRFSRKKRSFYDTKIEFMDIIWHVNRLTCFLLNIRYISFRLSLSICLSNVSIVFQVSNCIWGRQFEKYCKYFAQYQMRFKLGFSVYRKRGKCDWKSLTKLHIAFHTSDFESKCCLHTIIKFCDKRINCNEVCKFVVCFLCDKE